MSIRELIFQTFFPTEYLEWKYRYNHTRNYDMLVSTLIRSHPEEKEWSSRFVALENDYKALERECADLRVKNVELVIEKRTLAEMMFKSNPA
jgi:hypothetical protein